MLVSHVLQDLSITAFLAAISSTKRLSRAKRPHNVPLLQIIMLITIFANPVQGFARNAHIQVALFVQNVMRDIF